MNGAPGGSDNGEAVTSLSVPLNDASVGFIAALAASGIDVAEPLGWVTLDPGSRHVRIGFIVALDDGDVVVVPCVDATAVQIGEICRQAEDVKLDGPTGSQWTRLRNLEGWESAILEPVYGAPPTPQCPHAPLP